MKFNLTRLSDFWESELVACDFQEMKRKTTRMSKSDNDLDNEFEGKIRLLKGKLNFKKIQKKTTSLYPSRRTFLVERSQQWASGISRFELYLFIFNAIPIQKDFWIFTHKDVKPSEKIAAFDMGQFQLFCNTKLYDSFINLLFIYISYFCEIK